MKNKWMPENYEIHLHKNIFVFKREHFLYGSGNL